MSQLLLSVQTRVHVSTKAVWQSGGGGRWASSGPMVPSSPAAPHHHCHCRILPTHARQQYNNNIEVNTNVLFWKIKTRRFWTFFRRKSETRLSVVCPSINWLSLTFDFHHQSTWIIFPLFNFSSPLSRLLRLFVLL